MNSLDELRPDEHRQAVHLENGQGVFTVRFDPRVVDGLNALTRAGLVELRWVTTWSTSARDVLAPAIGLDPGSQVVEDREDPGLARHPYEQRPWWKLAGVLGALRGDPSRPVAWLDDDLDDSTKTRFPALHPGPSLLITPDSGEGLTLEQLATVEAFARRHAAR